MSSPVWIAGYGATCAAGADTREILESFRLGKRNPTTRLPFETSITAPTFQVDAQLPELPGRKNNSRTLRLAMRAIREAMTSAGIDRFDDNTRVGVALGTTVACQLNSVPFYDAYRRREQAGDPPLDAVYDFLNANLATAVGELLDLRQDGPRMTVVNACSSGTDAIGVAASWIRAGLCDVAVGGGADELNRVALAGFWSLGVMSTEPCAPFDDNRAGLNLGEGSGVVILESDAHANARRADNRFQLAGFAAACDAHHLTAPHPEGRGLEASIRGALTQANLKPHDIAFINAHGTATLDNDRAESKVIARIFGPEARFISSKGYTGHTLGAAGGLEAVFTLLALREGWLAPSAGFVQQGDDVPIAPQRDRTGVEGHYAMSTSLAFGGNNSALIIRRTS